MHGNIKEVGWADRREFQERWLIDNVKSLKSDDEDTRRDIERWSQS
jgi:hypothetical protein